MVIRLKKRSVFVVALILALTLATTFLGNNETVTVNSEITNWGLSFGKEGEAPRGNASAESLSEYDAYFIDTTDEKKLYLTFDAGFENGYTPQILDVLKAHDVKATFFLVSNYIDTAPELVRRMVEEGHTVANHTASHPDMSKIESKESFLKELCTLEEKYKEVTGKEMQKIYRPPQGKFSTQNLTFAQELGYKTVFWSLAYVDWYTDNQPTREMAFSKLIPRTHPGAIVLLHSTSKTNAEILDELLTRWENAGFRIAPIDELF